MTITTADAARLMSLPEAEIAAVEDHPHGDVIVTTDGVRNINCTVPDANGATGLMFLEKPNPDGHYAWPVFAPLPDDDQPAPAEPATDAATAAEQDAPPAGQPVPERPPMAGPGSGKKAWAAYAEANGVVVDADWSRDEIAAAVDAATS